jgi:hypothetical protein
MWYPRTNGASSWKRREVPMLVGFNVAVQSSSLPDPAGYMTKGLERRLWRRLRAESRGQPAHDIVSKAVEAVAT